jgi:arylsulfatase A-like enzyme
VERLRSARGGALLLLSSVLAAGGLSFAPGCSARAPAGAILIVVDTLRADHLGLYGYPRPTSPGLDAWSAQAAVFEQAFSASPWTLPSFGSMLTGETPSLHAAGRRVRESNWTISNRLNEALPTLPEALAAAGFATGAIVNNPFLPPSVGLDRGFATYDYRPPSASDERRADAVVDAALAWLDRHRDDERFFLMVHLIDPHMNYDAPPPFRGKFTAELAGGFALPVAAPRKIHRRAHTMGEAERAFVRAAYDEEIAFVDRELARFFEALRARSLWQRLLVVLTSDHGEELFEHGGFEHGHSVHQELLRVPLLFWGPGVAPARHQEPVSLVDLPETLLAGLGVAGFDSAAGQSLWRSLSAGAPLPDRLLTAEGTLYGPEARAAIRWPLKLMLEPGTGRRRLFDLEQDPEERTDLTPAQPETVRRLAQELTDTLAVAHEALRSSDVPIDGETLEGLRALGYVE